MLAKEPEQLADSVLTTKKERNALVQEKVGAYLHADTTGLAHVR